MRIIFECPYCDTRHNSRKWKEIARWECHFCHGVYTATSMMNNYCRKDYMGELVRELHEAQKWDKFCPICESVMVRFRSPGFSLTLGGCARCRFIWFSPGGETDFLRNSGAIKPEFAKVNAEDLPKIFGGLPREHPLFGGPMEQVFLGFGCLFGLVTVALLFRYWFFP